MAMMTMMVAVVHATQLSGRKAPRQASNPSSRA
jgi:hypothetical protein